MVTATLLRWTLLELLNAACTLIFILEAAIKIGAFHFGGYIRNPWHIFDFSIVLLSVGEWVLELLAATVGTNPTLLRILRMARVARLMRTFRVVKVSRALQTLLTMLVCSLPELINIISLFFLMLAMYALLGMQLFGAVSDGVLVGTEASFCTFSSAMIALFRCATTEGWNTIMHDLMYDEAKLAADGRACDPHVGSCGSMLAVPYLVSFMVLSAFVVLKMLIAVITPIAGWCRPGCRTRKLVDARPLVSSRSIRPRRDATREYSSPSTRSTFSTRGAVSTCSPPAGCQSAGCPRSYTRSRRLSG